MYQKFRPFALLCAALLSPSISFAQSPAGVIGSQTPKVAPAKPTGYAEVAPYLNSDGASLNFYDTRQIITAVQGAMAIFTDMVKAQGKDDPQAALGIKAIQTIYQLSGISSLAAVGSSSVPRDANLYYNRAFALRSPGLSQPGLIWNLLTEKSTHFDSLDMLPANTAYASFVNLDFAWLESNATKVAADFGQPVNIQDLVAPMGLDWKSISASLDNEIGLFMVLDPSKTITFPVEKMEMTMARPGLGILLRVKNDTIYQSVLKMSAGSQAKEETQNDVKLLSMPLPNPVMDDLSPTVTVIGKYLVIATHRELALELAAVQSGKSSGLTKSKEFQTLSRDVPLEGNAFSYSNQILQDTITATIGKAVSESMAKSPEANVPKPFVDFMTSMFVPKPSFSAIQRVGPNWLMTSNGPAQGDGMGISSSPATVAMLSAIAVPNFLRARKRSQATRILEDARTLDACIDQYAIENNLTGDAPVTFENCTNYLKRGTKLANSEGKDMLGNPFILNTVDDSVKINPATIEQLKDVAPPEFWAPFAE